MVASILRRIRQTGLKMRVPTEAAQYACPVWKLVGKVISTDKSVLLEELRGQLKEGLPFSRKPLSVGARQGWLQAQA